MSDNNKPVTTAWLDSLSTATKHQPSFGGPKWVLGVADNRQECFVREVPPPNVTLFEMCCGNTSLRVLMNRAEVFAFCAILEVPIEVTP